MCVCHLTSTSSSSSCSLSLTPLAFLVSPHTQIPINSTASRPAPLLLTEAKSKQVNNSQSEGEHTQFYTPLVPPWNVFLFSPLVLHWAQLRIASPMHTLERRERQKQKRMDGERGEEHSHTLFSLFFPPLPSSSASRHRPSLAPPPKHPTNPKHGLPRRRFTSPPLTPHDPHHRLSLDSLSLPPTPLPSFTPQRTSLPDLIKGHGVNTAPSHPLSLPRASYSPRSARKRHARGPLCFSTPPPLLHLSLFPGLILSLTLPQRLHFLPAYPRHSSTAPFQASLRSWPLRASIHTVRP